MPQVKGMRLPKWKRLKETTPPVLVVLRRRNRPKGYGPNQPVTLWIDPLATVYDPSQPLNASLRAYALTPQDQDNLREYRRSLNACEEGACLCTCLCHQHTTCQVEDPSPFHSRTPNTSHKRTHKECPKGDTHKW